MKFSGMNPTDSTASSPVFLSAPASPGELFDCRADRDPTIVFGWRESRLELNTDDSGFGFVGSGRTTLSCASGSFELSCGMYFAVPGPAAIEGTGVGFVASRIGYRGLFQLGGPIEESGRLQYIDGCSDSLLVAPVMSGDPCLNLLHIPPQTDQTAHTHPSLRIGIVVDGTGLCRTPQGDNPLTAGQVFLIHADGLHSFHTHSHSLRIVAWHPDSDCGPTHEQHPMLNRTLIGGQPVNARKDSS